MSTWHIGHVHVMTPGYPGVWPMPKPRRAPRVPAYFPRMKVRGGRRREKWMCPEYEVTLKRLIVATNALDGCPYDATGGSRDR